MTLTPVQAAEHVTTVAAPADRAYRLVADVTRWPVLFAPCVAVQVLDSADTSERIRLWALVNDDVRTWTSVRELDDERLRIDFHQETPSPPVTSMSGSWRFEPVGADRTRVVLGHEWATSGTASQSEQIAGGLHRNSESELAAIRSWAERPEPPDELIFSFADELAIAGSPREVYEFLHDADRWPMRLAHVAHVDLRTGVGTPAGARVQTLDMDTTAADGSTHRTRSVRLCLPYERILYKQTTLPRGLLGHSGEWLVTAVREGTLVVARHRVALDPAALGDLLGPGVRLAEARQRVRESLGGNSRRTLAAARLFVAGAQAHGDAR